MSAGICICLVGKEPTYYIFISIMRCNYEARNTIMLWKMQLLTQNTLTLFNTNEPRKSMSTTSFSNFWINNRFPRSTVWNHSSCVGLHFSMYLLSTILTNYWFYGEQRSASGAQPKVAKDTESLTSKHPLQVSVKAFDKVCKNNSQGFVVLRYFSESRLVLTCFLYTYITWTRSWKAWSSAVFKFCGCHWRTANRLVPDPRASVEHEWNGTMLRQWAGSQW